MTDYKLEEKIKDYVEAAYLNGLPCENLDTGELESPSDISDIEWITNSILDLLKAERNRVLDEILGLKRPLMFKDLKEDEPCEVVFIEAIKKIRRDE